MTASELYDLMKKEMGVDQSKPIILTYMTITNVKIYPNGKQYVTAKSWLKDKEVQHKSKKPKKVIKDFNVTEIQDEEVY